MFLVRHNSLQGAYSDYSKLSLEQLDTLMLNDCPVGIKDITLDDVASVGTHFENILKSADFIVCSENSRAIQTCTQLMHLLDIKKRIHIDSDANEIAFTPSLLVKNECRHIDFLDIIRERVFVSIFGGTHGTESVASIINRVGNLMLKYGKQNTVIFTHGFLIRFIVASTIAKEEGIELNAEMILARTQPVGYLELMEI